MVSLGLSPAPRVGLADGRGGVSCEGAEAGEAFGAVVCSELPSLEPWVLCCPACPGHTINPKTTTHNLAVMDRLFRSPLSRQASPLLLNALIPALDVQVSCQLT